MNQTSHGTSTELYTRRLLILARPAADVPFVTVPVYQGRLVLTHNSKSSANKSKGEHAISH
jgi:hypothetical protein